MRRYFLLLMLLLLAFPVTAQIGDDSPPEMIPFSSAPLDIQGLRPDGWATQDNSEGVFVRMRDPLDLTAIIIQAQDNTKEAFVANVAASFQIEGDLEPVEMLETDFFTWDLYVFEREQSGQQVVVDMGIAEDTENGRIYYVLLQTNPVFYDDLHEQVFIPAVTWLSPIQYYTDPDESYRVPVPVQWEVNETEDGFARLANPDGSIAIFMSAVESDDAILASQEFIALINPEFDSTFDEETHTLNLIDDPLRIGDLEAVYIIDWVDPQNEEGFVLQSVARVYDGTVYMTVIIASIDAIVEDGEQVVFIDNGFSITALEESAEATEEPQQ